MSVLIRVHFSAGDRSLDFKMCWRSFWRTFVQLQIPIFWCFIWGFSVQSTVVLSLFDCRLREGLPMQQASMKFGITIIAIRILLTHNLGFEL